MAQDKTEEASEYKLQKAREKGQVPRSKELSTAVVLLISACSLYLLRNWFHDVCDELLRDLLNLDRVHAFDITYMMKALSAAIFLVITPVAVMGLVNFIFTIVGTVLIGGIVFSTSPIAFKISKLSPLKGFKRMFGMQALVELVKSILKVLVVAFVAYSMINVFLLELFSLPFEVYKNNIAHGLTILFRMYIALCFAMFFIVLIDAPYQIFKFKKDQKMTKQEVKEEHKNIDGNPIIKQRIRQLQYEMSNRPRANAAAGNADAVVVNPEHYAVALVYDVSKAKSPFVVTKGVDAMAFVIREAAIKNNVPIIASPNLARAIYYTTRINQEIPEPLFYAVAQVMAYIYQLNKYKAGEGDMPNSLPRNFKIPDNLDIPEEARSKA